MEQRSGMLGSFVPVPTGLIVQDMWRMTADELRDELSALRIAWEASTRSYTEAHSKQKGRADPKFATEPLSYTGESTRESSSLLSIPVGDTNKGEEREPETEEGPVVESDPVAKRSTLGAAMKDGAPFDVDAACRRFFETDPLREEMYTLVEAAQSENKTGKMRTSRAWNQFIKKLFDARQKGHTDDALRFGIGEALSREKHDMRYVVAVARNNPQGEKGASRARRPATRRPSRSSGRPESVEKIDEL